MSFKTFILIFILFITVQIAVGQNGWSVGYVIENGGQKIKGEIKDRGEAFNCNKVRFRSFTGEKIKYKNKSLQGYYVNGKDYVMMPHQRPIGIFKSKFGFMKVLMPGKLNLYQYTYTVHSSGSMGPNGVMMGGYSSERSDYYLYKGIGNVFLVKKSGFKRNVSSYLSANIELAQKIRERDLKYRDIEEIVRIYNDKK